MSSACSCFSQLNIPISFQVGENKIVTDKWLTGPEKCVFNLGTYAHNPLKDWLQARMKREFPAFRIDSNSATVDWGLAETFNCNLTISKIKRMHLEMHHDEIHIDSLIQVKKLIPS